MMLTVTARPHSSRTPVGWRAGGLVYLAFCLAGLAAGLWYEAIYPSRLDVVPAPLPVLRALAVAQAAFILLAHPVILLGRCERGHVRRFLLEAALETAVLLAVTAPFYVAAAFLGDATRIDVVRTVAYLACLGPLGWAAGYVMCLRPRWRSFIVALMLAIVALPAVYYILREFLPMVHAAWLWPLAPLTAAWDVAASRQASYWPPLTWTTFAWLGLALAMGILANVGDLDEGDEEEE
jgi:hypothetical protein